jgi:hypothetical protein
MQLERVSEGLDKNSHQHLAAAYSQTLGVTAMKIQEAAKALLEKMFKFISGRPTAR